MSRKLFYSVTLPFAFLITLARILQIKNALDESGLFDSSNIFSVVFVALLAVFAVTLIVVFRLNKGGKTETSSDPDIFACAGCIALIAAFCVRTGLRFTEFFAGGMTVTCFIKAVLSLLAVVGAFSLLLVTRGANLTTPIIILSLTPVYSLTAELVLTFVPITENSQIFGYMLFIFFTISSMSALYLMVKKMFYLKGGQLGLALSSVAAVTGCAQAVCGFMSYPGAAQTSLGENLFAVLLTVFFLLAAPYFATLKRKVSSSYAADEEGKDGGEEQDREDGQ